MDIIQLFKGENNNLNGINSLGQGATDLPRCLL